jgi:hypothetical protein
LPEDAAQPVDHRRLDFGSGNPRDRAGVGARGATVGNARSRCIDTQQTRGHHDDRRLPRQSAQRHVDDGLVADVDAELSLHAGKKVLQRACREPVC